MEVKKQNSPLINIEKLSISIGDKKLLDEVDLCIHSNEVLGLVGESGSGKSLTANFIMGFTPKQAKVNAKKSTWLGEFELQSYSEKDFQEIRGNEMGMIFQEPMSALNPSMKCGKQIKETVVCHYPEKEAHCKEDILELFERVKLPDPERIYNAYPHELSGGQRQRVIIVNALINQVKLLIADEPTTALDVQVQKEIMILLRELKDEFNVGILFISHDLALVSEIADHITVMQKGKIVETGTTHDIFTHPKQPYTQGLLNCRPTLETNVRRLPTVSDFIEHKPMDDRPKVTVDSSVYNLTPLLEVKNISTYFYKPVFLGKKELISKAVDDVSFKVFPGETFGLVGESGCGKSTLSKTILGLEKATSGEIFFEGKDLTKLSKREWKKLRKNIQIIFQDPYSSLNPKLSVGQQLEDPLKVHFPKMTSSERMDKINFLLSRVGLDEDSKMRYPHEFSGGQRQRICIARAIILDPQFVICDESVSALDVSVQAQVINLLNDLKDEFNFTYIFISHDLSVVKYISDRIMVMQSGKVVEINTSENIYKNPQSDYTKALIDAIPTVNLS